jgi:hypothetical protein
MADGRGWWRVGGGGGVSVVARVGGSGFSHGAFRKSDDIPLPRFICLDPLNNNLSRDWSSVNSMEIG